MAKQNFANKPTHKLYYLFSPADEKFAYVGQTVGNVAARWRAHQHQPRQNNSALWDALQQSPAEDWKVWVIGQTKYAGTANHLEEAFIRLFGTYSPRGLNLATGGRSSSPTLTTFSADYYRRPLIEEELPSIFRRELGLYHVRSLLKDAGKAYSPAAACEWVELGFKQKLQFGTPWTFSCEAEKNLSRPLTF